MLKSKAIMILFFIGCIYFLTGCVAGMFASKYQTIRVTSTPSGAPVYVRGSRNSDSRYQGDTPVTITIERTGRGFDLEIGSETIHVDPRLNHLVWGNFIYAAGAAPLLKDGSENDGWIFTFSAVATAMGLIGDFMPSYDGGPVNAYKNYPKSVHVNLSAIHNSVASAFKNVPARSSIAVQLSIENREQRNRLTSEIESAILQQGYRIVDRNAIDTAIRTAEVELAYGDDGWQYDDKTALSMGRFVQAPYVVAGRIEGNRLQFRVLHVETGHVEGIGFINIR